MTKDEILSAAAQIISQKGFHAASMQDIAHAVNLQKASLYHHVSSKQDILLALLDRALDLLIEQIEPVAQQSVPADRKLRQAMVVYLQAMLEQRELASVLLLEHRSLEPQYHSLHIPRRDRFERLWRDMLQEGVGQGIFACTDPAFASRSLLGVMNWTITWYNPDGSLSPCEIAEQTADLFFNGLLVRTG
ncbi:MAG: TetR/AcrR family transcriptional regulator [Anaerolineales bacterium]